MNRTSLNEHTISVIATSGALLFLAMLTLTSLPPYPGYQTPVPERTESGLIP